jgi:hypothetical protein
MIDSMDKYSDQYNCVCYITEYATLVTYCLHCPLCPYTVLLPSVTPPFPRPLFLARGGF